MDRELLVVETCQLVIRTKSSAEYDEGRPTTTCHINAETNFNPPRLLLLVYGIIRPLPSPLSLSFYAYIIIRSNILNQSL